MMPVCTKNVDMFSENFEASLRSLCEGTLTVLTVKYSWDDDVSGTEYTHALK